MLTTLKSALAAATYFCMGLGAILNPFWWWRPVHNSNTRTGFELDRRASFLYKLDLCWQILRGRPWQGARRRWMARVEAQAAALPPGAVSGLPEFDWRRRPFSELHSEYIDAQHPVVLRGLLHEYVSVDEWRLGRLAEELGDRALRLSCPGKADYVGTLAELQLPGVQLHEAETVFDGAPELFARTGLEPLGAELKGELKYAGVTQLLVGRQASSSALRCAPGHTIFMMLDGRERWTLIDPAYSPLCAPKIDGGQGALHYLSEVPPRAEDREGPRPQAARSLAKAPRYEVVLEAGDVLIHAPWWWREVEEQSEAAVGAASRWFDFRALKPNNPIFESLLMLSPRTSFRSSMAAFAETLMTLEGALVCARGRAPRLRGRLTPRVGQVLS